MEAVFTSTPKLLGGCRSRRSGRSGGGRSRSGRGGIGRSGLVISAAARVAIAATVAAATAATAVMTAVAAIAATMATTTTATVMMTAVAHATATIAAASAAQKAGRCIATEHGETNDREENRNSKDNKSVHSGILQIRLTGTVSVKTLMPSDWGLAA